MKFEYTARNTSQHNGKKSFGNLVWIIWMSEIHVESSWTQQNHEKLGVDRSCSKSFQIRRYVG